MFYLQFLTKFYVTNLCSEKTTALEVVILLNHLEKAMKMVDGNIIFKNHVFRATTVQI